MMEEASEQADTPISEVLVHVDTAPHDSTCPLQSSVLGASRGHTLVEADVRRTLLAQPEVVAVSRVHVFYLASGVAVEAQCRMLEHLTVAQLREVASRGRSLLLDGSADGLVDAKISLDLGDGSDGNGDFGGVSPMGGRQLTASSA